MADNSSNSSILNSKGKGESVARLLLAVRLGSLENLRKERMTPLLHDEMRHITETHSDALKLPSFTEHMDLLEDLDSLHERFIGHWEKVHKDYLSYSLLINSMARVELFLTRSFQEDYMLLPPRANEWAEDAAPLITVHRLGKAKDDGKDYHETVVLPLQEMGLDVGYVEEKALLNLDGMLQERRNGYVAHLMQTRDWQKLAETLVKDRQLASDFFEHETIVSESHNADTLRRVHDRMEWLELRYFERLSSPTDFKLSKLALELSAGEVEVLNSDGTPAVIEDEKSPARIPGMRHAKSILSSVAGSIKALRTSPATGSRANPVADGKRHDEKTPLVDSKEV